MSLLSVAWTENEWYWHDKRCGCEDPGGYWCKRHYPTDLDWCEKHGWAMEECCK